MIFASPLESHVLFAIGPVPISQPVATTWGIMAVLTIGSWLLTRRLALRPTRAQAALELVVETVAGQIRGTMEAEPRRYLPLIGTLDSARAQEVMENLLQTILERQAEVVIMDITGVGTVDTQVAQHLLRAAAAVRLMGAECIISGISPMIAQTMVQLGIDVGTVSTRSSIRTALSDALLTVGYVIKKTEGQ